MKENKKPDLGRIVSLVLFMALCLAAGAVLGRLMDLYLPAGAEWGTMILYLLLTLVIFYAAWFVQILLHEAGHLVFGRLSGYTFCSFRIFSFMWVKTDAGVRRCRYSLAGTGGQCLMAPPDWNEGRFPFVLYNLGGALMNLITALLFLGLWALLPRTGLLSMGLIALALCGLLCAATNAIPLRVGPVDNDGCNVVNLRRSPAARRSFWVQLKVNQQITMGRRLREMPEEWFCVDDRAGEENNAVAAAARVLRSDRLMDEHRFPEAEAYLAALCSPDSGALPLHLALMTCNRMTLEMMGPCRPETVEAMRTREQMRIMQKMKDYPSVLRTEYLYEALCRRDQAAADKKLARFDAVAERYPYPCEIRGERELMELALARDRDPE